MYVISYLVIYSVYKSNNNNYKYAHKVVQFIKRIVEIKNKNILKLIIVKQ